MSDREPTARERAEAAALQCSAAYDAGDESHGADGQACDACVASAIRSAELAAEARAVTRLIGELVSAADGWRSAPADGPEQLAFNDMQAWRGQSAAFVAWHISSVRPTCPPPEAPGDDPAELAAARKMQDACVAEVMRAARFTAEAMDARADGLTDAQHRQARAQLDVARIHLEGAVRVLRSLSPEDVLRETWGPSPLRPAAEEQLRKQRTEDVLRGGSEWGQSGAQRHGKSAPVDEDVLRGGV